MKMREQRLMGLVMVILSGWLLAWAFAGQTPEKRDVTAVLLTLPLGLYMVYSDELIIYGDALEESERELPEEDEPLSRRSRPAAQGPDFYRQAGASPAKYTTQSKMKGAV